MPSWDVESFSFIVLTRLLKPSTDFVVCENRIIGREKLILLKSFSSSITMALPSVWPSSPITSAWPILP